MSDQYFDSVVSLCHDEAGGDLSQTFDQIAGVNWALAGGCTRSDVWAEHGMYSLLFNGTTAYAQTFDIADFGVQDFCIETTVRTSVGGVIFSIYSNGVLTAGMNLNIHTDGKLHFNDWTGARVITGNTDLRDNNPHKIALARVGGVIRVFVDGVQDHASGYADARDYVIGDQGFVWGVSTYSYSTWFNGYQDERRVTIGNGRYESNYTPTTDQFPDSSGNPATEVLDYPAEFVRPDHTNYSGVIEYGLLRTTVPTVQPYQYKRNNSQNVKLTLNFSMMNVGYATWLNWVNDNAYNWFTMELVAPHYPTNEILSVQKIRFISDISYAKRGHDWLTVSVEVEVYQGTDGALPDRTDDDWILAGTPAAPATDWIIGGTPAAPSTDWIVAQFYEV